MESARRIALLHATLAAVAIAAAVLVPAPATALGEVDPAGINGTWQYRTRSNCGSVEGVGKLWLGWDPERERYDERGMVYWSDSDLVINWWGTATFREHARELDARVDNSLGDRVRSTWRVIGNPPTRLVVQWSQTNGCHGVGIARRSFRR